MKKSKTLCYRIEPTRRGGGPPQIPPPLVGLKNDTTAVANKTFPAIGEEDFKKAMQRLQKRTVNLTHETLPITPTTKPA